MTIIGTDPAFRKNGMAVFIFDTDTKEYYIKIFKGLRDFQKWIDGLTDEKPPQTAIVGVENSGDVEIVMERNYQAFLMQSKLRHNQRIRDKYAISVGKNIAATKYAIELFEKKYKPRNVYKISPLQKGGKLSEHGLKVMYQLELSGSEQDERDAAVICMKTLHLHLGELRKKELLKTVTSK